MSITRLTSFFLLLLLPLLFTACLKDSFTRTYTLYKPVFKTRAEVLANVRSSAPSKTINAGKIYLHGNYIFLNDVQRGIHVIDNTDPSSPKKVAFIDIPGSADIAVKGNILYADIFSDLIAIDISDPLHVKLAKTVTNVFKDKMYLNNIRVPEDKYIVDWIRYDTVVDQAYDGRRPCISCLYSSTAPQAAVTVSTGGSMSRFAMVNNYMYAVSTFDLTSIDITSPADPQVKNFIPIGTSIETIYPVNNNLFVGSAMGMIVLSVNDPSRPTTVSAFQHATSCDPVVANNQHAFVTLRTGTFCGGSTSNQLDILNVSDITKPKLEKTYALTNPHGLALDNEFLWICDGADGMKLYNISNPYDIRLLKTIPGMDAFDVILYNKRMIVTAKEGLIQFDYSDLNNIRRLSTINTANF